MRYALSMSQAATSLPQEPTWEVRAPDTSHLITDDGAPVDSFLSEKQMRLLTLPLYEGWSNPQERPMLAAANVGVFAVPRNNPLVPDVFLSLDVETPKLTGDERNRSYFVWDFGKPPDVVIEIVSDTEGGELTTKLRGYERMRVPNYVVFDPLGVASNEMLSVFRLEGGAYVQQALKPLPGLEDATETTTRYAVITECGLGLRLWNGSYEDITETWLRWCEPDGALIPTGAERAEHEAERAEHEAKRAEHEAKRAEDAERELAKLRAELEQLRRG